LVDNPIDGVRKIADDLMYWLCDQPRSGVLAAASRKACKDTDIIDMSTGRTHDEDLGALIYKNMSDAYWICNVEDLYA